MLPVALMAFGMIDASAAANTPIEGSLLDLWTVFPHRKAFLKLAQRRTRRFPALLPVN